jgi:hypothetical protein
MDCGGNLGERTSMSIDSTVPARAVERYDRIKALGSVPPWWRFRARRRWLQEFTAIMALDISTSAEILRKLYPTDAVQQMAEWTRPTFTKGKTP